MNFQTEMVPPGSIQNWQTKGPNIREMGSMNSTVHLNLRVGKNSIPFYTHTMSDHNPDPD